MSKISDMGPVGPLRGTELVEVIQENLSGKFENKQMALADLFSSGQSAYEAAVEDGFDGTIEDWVLSLKGVDGDVGPQGEQGVAGKSAYEIAQENGYLGTEEEFIAAINGANSINGGVFVVGIVPQKGTDNVGDFEYSADEKSVVNCSSTTSDVRVSVLALPGHSNYRPVVTVNGSPVTLAELGATAVFSGTVNVTAAGDGKITAVHEDGATWESTLTLDTPPKVLTGIFTGSYPVGQTELKEGDTANISVTTDLDIVAYEVADNGAFKVKSGTVAATKSLVVNALVIANRGNTSTSHGFRIRVQKATGAWSEWFNSTSAGAVDRTNVVKLNNLYPVINFGAVSYPAGQSALKGAEAGVVNHTITNADVYNYTSTDLTIATPSAYQPAKSINRKSGTYNDNVKNFNVTAKRNSNGATTTDGVIVKIAEGKPTLTISMPAARLRSGGNAGTNAQMHVITITSNQSLTEAPTLNAPGGVWEDGVFTSNAAAKVWTRRLKVHDNDAKGTFNFNSLVAKGLSGEVQNTFSGSDAYVIGGFVFRTLVVPAYPVREIAIGTDVAMTTKLRCSNLSKGASGSFNFGFQGSVAAATDKFSITGPSGVFNVNGNLWYNADGGNAASNTAGTMKIELEELV